MKKVLIITYYWVPAGGVAVQRFLKFTKYLRDYGWEPVILTVKDGSYPYTDPKLEEQVPKGIEVHRTKTFEPFEIYNLLRGQKGKTVPLAVATASRKSLFQKLSGYIRANFFLPDARVGWKPYAIKEASQIISEQDIKAVITTGPPHSTHLIGQSLKEKFGLPWVADFRDPWTEIFNNQYLPFTESSKAKDKKMEASVLQDCDVATVIGDGMKSVFPDQFRSKMLVITNGYDEEDYDRSLKPETDKFRMRYVGNLFSNQNISALWEAIAELRKEAADFSNDFELELIGKADSAISESITAAGLDTCTKYVSFVPHQDAIAKMQTSSILLSVIPEVANNKLIITGKIFEYMGSGRPIFLIGPADCDAAIVVSQSHSGRVHDYTDKAKMKVSLLYYYQQFKEKGQTETASGITQYSRKELTGKLANVLNGLVK
jgi:glycosyltransferase involved in cell wall biosynthesis